MAIIEIAKIQVRRGDARTTGMPQLDTGEFGWAIQGTQPESIRPELFIGNKISDGAAVNTNTRILTELDLPNIYSATLGLNTATYTFQANQNPVLLTTPIARSLQSKLDDYVSLRDMNINPGAGVLVGINIQDAINDLFINSDKSLSESRIRLNIHPGEYFISNTIYLPPNIEIIGAGKDKTIINYVNTTTSGPIFQFVDQTSSAGGYVTLGSMTNGTKPKNVVLSGMTLQYWGTDTFNSSPMILADCLSDSIIEDLKFTLFENTTTSASNAGISVRGEGALTSEKLIVRNCIFENLHYGIVSNYDVEDLTIENNRFYNLNRGIVFGENLVGGNTTGPKRSRIKSNKFNYIKNEGVLITATNLTVVNGNNLADNIFIDVGNDLNGDTSAVTSPVTFGTFGNSSFNDYFSRFEVQSDKNAVSNFIAPISGKVNIIDNTIRTHSFVNSDSTGTIIRLSSSPKPLVNIRIKYQIQFDAITRTGELTINSSVDPSNSVLDEYGFTGANDGGINFITASNTFTNSILLNYTNNSLDGIMSYQINQYY